MATAEEIPWLVVGGEAYVMTYAGWGYRKRSIKKVTILKVGKRDVTTDYSAHSTFSVRTARPSSDDGEIELHVTGQTYSSTVLIGPEDPRVPGLLRQMRLRSMRSAARSSIEEWFGEQDESKSIELARRAAVRLTKWADAMEEE